MVSHVEQQTALEAARLLGARAFGSTYRRNQPAPDRSVLADLLAKHRSPVLAGASRLTLNPSQEILDEEQRREVLARLERAQAEHGAKLVRAAGEAVPNSDAPAITPDTVWSGDFDILVELFRISLHRVNTTAAYLSGRPSRCWMGFLGGPAMRQAPMPNTPAHEQP